MCVACVYTAERCNTSSLGGVCSGKIIAHYLISQSLNVAAVQEPNNAAITHKCCNSAVFFMLSLFNQNLRFLLMFPLKVNHSCDGRANSIMVVLS